MQQGLSLVECYARLLACNLLSSLVSHVIVFMYIWCVTDGSGWQFGVAVSDGVNLHG